MDEEDVDYKDGKDADTKGGVAVSKGVNGYQIGPDVLMRNQHQLGLDATDMVGLLNICMHWWEQRPEEMPHPRPVTIAKRMGTSTRTVERHIERMCNLGLVQWLPLEKRQKGPGVRKFDLNGLVSKLRQIARATEIVRKTSSLSLEGVEVRQ